MIRLSTTAKRNKRLLKWAIGLEMYAAAPLCMSEDYKHKVIQAYLKTI